MSNSLALVAFFESAIMLRVYIRLVMMKVVTDLMQDYYERTTDTTNEGAT